MFTSTGDNVAMQCCCDATIHAWVSVPVSINKILSHPILFYWHVSPRTSFCTLCLWLLGWRVFCDVLAFRVYLKWHWMVVGHPNHFCSLMKYSDTLPITICRLTRSQTGPPFVCRCHHPTCARVCPSASCRHPVCVCLHTSVLFVVLYLPHNVDVVWGSPHLG